MVRTKADAKAVAAKAPRKNPERSSAANHHDGGDVSGKGRERAGGNLYCPRETPGWQKPITSFFIQPNESGESSSERGNEMGLARSPDSRPTYSTSATSAGASTSTDD